MYNNKAHILYASRLMCLGQDPAVHMSYHVLLVCHAMHALSGDNIMQSCPNRDDLKPFFTQGCSNITSLRHAQILLALSNSHCSTHIASDLASQALASQARPQRESESQASYIARYQSTRRHFAPQANIAGFSQELLWSVLWFQSKQRGVFSSLAIIVFRVASDLDWRCAIRIASHIAVASRDSGHSALAASSNAEGRQAFVPQCRSWTFGRRIYTISLRCDFA